MLLCVCVLLDLGGSSFVQKISLFGAVFPKVGVVRVCVQTILGKISIIVMLGGGGLGLEIKIF